MQSHGPLNWLLPWKHKMSRPMSPAPVYRMTSLYFFSCECAHSSVKSSQSSGLKVWIRSATGNAMPDETGVAVDPALPNFSFRELSARVLASMLSWAKLWKQDQQRLLSLL